MDVSTGDTYDQPSVQAIVIEILSRMSCALALTQRADGRVVSCVPKRRVRRLAHDLNHIPRRRNIVHVRYRNVGCERHDDALCTRSISIAFCPKGLLNATRPCFLLLEGAKCLELRKDGSFP